MVKYIKNMVALVSKLGFKLLIGYYMKYNYIYIFFKSDKLYLCAEIIKMSTGKWSHKYLNYSSDLFQTSFVFYVNL